MQAIANVVQVRSSPYETSHSFLISLAFLLGALALILLLATEQGGSRQGVALRGRVCDYQYC